MKKFSFHLGKRIMDSNGSVFIDFYLNPIPAGLLENQDMLGGVVNLTPPPLNPMFYVQI